MTTAASFPVTLRNQLDQAVVVRLGVTSTDPCGCGSRGPTTASGSHRPARSASRSQLDAVTSGRLSFDAQLLTPRGAAYDDPVTRGGRRQGFGQITFVVFGAAVALLVLAAGIRIFRRIRRRHAGAGMTDLPSDNRSTLRSSSVMAVGTITSRVTGLLKNSALLAAVGGGVFADTYSVANTLPTIVYFLLVGGAINAVFIPQLVRHMASDDDEGLAYAQRLFSAVVLALAADHRGCGHRGAVAGAALLHRTGTREDVEVATAFARLLMPQIFFYGVFALVSQILNTRGRFGPPMFAPVLNNIVIIASALAFLAVAGTGTTTKTVTSGEILLLGVGTTLGAALQVVVLWPSLRRCGVRLRLRTDLRGQGLGAAWALARWAILLVLVNQIGTLVIIRLATGINVTSDGDAGVTVYQMAFAIFMMPQSVITVSLVTAVLPAPLPRGGSRASRRHAGTHRLDAADLGLADRAGLRRLHRARGSDLGAALPLRLAEPRVGPPPGPDAERLRPRSSCVQRLLRPDAGVLRARGHPNPHLQRHGAQRVQRRSSPSPPSSGCRPTWRSLPSVWPTRSPTGSAWRRWPTSSAAGWSGSTATSWCVPTCGSPWPRCWRPSAWSSGPSRPRPVVGRADRPHQQRGDRGLRAGRWAPPATCWASGSSESPRSATCCAWLPGRR